MLPMTPLQSWLSIAALFALVGLIVYVIAAIETHFDGRRNRRQGEHPADAPAKPEPAHEPAFAPVYDIAAARARRTLPVRSARDGSPRSGRDEPYDHAVHGL